MTALTDALKLLAENVDVTMDSLFVKAKEADAMAGASSDGPTVVISQRLLGMVLRELGERTTPPSSKRRPTDLKPLTTDTVWQARLDGYDPRAIRKTWAAFWGATPDSVGIGHLVPDHLLRAWRADHPAHWRP